MLHYLTRRILLAGLTLLLITLVVYGLIRAMPGNAVMVNLAESDPSRMPSEADIKRMEAAYGLDRPWYEAYWGWLGRLAGGDLGESIQHKKPVFNVIGDRVGPTLLLSVTSLLLTYLLAVPMGLFSTVRRNHWDERTLSTVLYMLYALPSFVAALLLLYVFYENAPFEWMKLEPGIVSADYDALPWYGKMSDIAWHMLLPVVCYSYGALAYLSRFVKANMEEVIRQDYIRTARAKGVHPTKVVCWHAFRNTMIPFVTMIGLTLPSLLSGAIILEQIFSWPGMGQLFFESISTQDYPVLMGLTLLFAILTLIGQLLADILYAVVDPRITYS